MTEVAHVIVLLGLMGIIQNSEHYWERMSS